MTTKGAERLRAELERLKSVKRPRIISAIAEARAHGDLKENAEYHAAREQQGFIEGRIKRARRRAVACAGHRHLDASTPARRSCSARRCELADEDTGEEKRYQIVGDLEADIKQGLISVSSPFARALIGKSEGDSVDHRGTRPAPASTRSSKSATAARAADLAQATFLLPAAARFGGQQTGAATARALGRADRKPQQQPGRRAQLLRHFDLVPKHWAIAALTRQAEAGDAAGACWLRADPAHVRPDINGARLLACGEMLALDDDDRAAFLPALKPLFGDAGFAIDAPTPAHWYLRLPREAKLPEFTEPDDASGCRSVRPSRRRQRRPPLARPARRGAGGAAQPSLERAARRARQAAGQLAVVLGRRRVAGRGPFATCRGLFERRVRPRARPRRQHRAAHARALRRHARATPSSTCTTCATWRCSTRHGCNPRIEALGRGDLQRLTLDFADGSVHELTRGQRWRFWRKPLPRLDA